MVNLNCAVERLEEQWNTHADKYAIAPALVKKSISFQPWRAEWLRNPRSLSRKNGNQRQDMSQMFAEESVEMSQ